MNTIKLFIAVMALATVIAVISTSILFTILNICRCVSFVNDPIQNIVLSIIIFITIYILGSALCNTKDDFWLRKWLKR